MIVLSNYGSTEQLKKDITKVAILASILSSKAIELSEQLNTSEEIYNPISRKSLGRLTKQFNDIQDIAYEIGNISEL